MLSESRIPEPEANDRPVKRQRCENITTHEPILSEETSVVRRHPLGVRPSGNAFTSKVNLKHACGLLASLPDELIVQILEGLEAESLLRLGGACRALHAFTRNEELWRALFVE